MIIRMLRAGLLIGDTVWNLGDLIDVEDGVGRRLVEQGAAERYEALVDEGEALEPEVTGDEPLDDDQDDQDEPLDDDQDEPLDDDQDERLVVETTSGESLETATLATPRRRGRPRKVPVE